jgi:hypothetical protein
VGATRFLVRIVGRVRAMELTMLMNFRPSEGGRLNLLPSGLVSKSG